jgi:hypothetical protein
MPAGTTYTAHYRVAGLSAAQSTQMLTAATLDPLFTQRDSYPVYVYGNNDFETSRSDSQPHNAMPWLGGDWDQTVGHGDDYSLRLTGGLAGKDVSTVDIGDSAFSEPIRAGTYTITAWVKTAGAQGGGARLGIQRLYPDQTPTYYPQSITGTSDWQKVQWTVTLPASGALRLILRLDGAGTAWFDDVEVAYPPT